MHTCRYQCHTAASRKHKLPTMIFFPLNKSHAKKARQHVNLLEMDIETTTTRGHKDELKELGCCNTHTASVGGHDTVAITLCCRQRRLR